MGRDFGTRCGRPRPPERSRATTTSVGRIPDGEAFVRQGLLAGGRRPELDQAAATLRAGGATQGTVEGGSQRSLPDPVNPLLRLVDATIARAQAAGDRGLADRADALRARLAALPRKGLVGGASLEQSRMLETLVRALSDVRDPGIDAERARLGYLAGLAQQGGGSGIDPTAFDLHRQQTLQLLEAVRQPLTNTSGSAARDPASELLLARVVSLEQRVLGTYFGMPPDVAEARDRFVGARQQDRARIDAELDAAGLRSAAPAEAHRALDPPLDRQLARLRVRLLAVGTAPRLSGVTPDEARTVIAALLGTEARDAGANSALQNRCAYLPRAVARRHRACTDAVRGRVPAGERQVRPSASCQC